MNKEPLAVEEISVKYQMVADNGGSQKGYKQTEVGAIPEDWEIRDCADVCIKIQDGTHFSPVSGGNDYMYVTSKNIRFGFLDISNVDRIDAEQHNAIFKRCDVRRGDLLLTKDGANTGNAALNDLVEEFSLLSSVAFLRFDPGKNHAGYFLQQILSTPGQQQIREAMSGNAITRLTLEKIKKLRFAVATLPEQHAIATTLSDVDDLLAKLDQLIAKKRDLKLAAMQQLLTGQIRLPGFSGEWKNVFLAEVIDVLADYTANGSFESLKDNVKYYESRNFAVLVRTTDLDKPIFNPERFTDEKGYKFLSKTSLFGGEIVIANVGSIGKVFKVPFFDMPMTLAPNTYLLKFKIIKVSENYIYHWMKTETFYQKLISKIGSTTLQAINKDNLRSIDLRIPMEVGEQTAIASILSDMDAEIAALETRRDKTKDIKQGMMQELLTGRIRLL
jgi:type I restriction enzyme S subunit